MKNGFVQQIERLCRYVNDVKANSVDPVEKEGKQYCCNKCAAGSKNMLFMFIPLIMISISVGFLARNLATQNILKIKNILN